VVAEEVVQEGAPEAPEEVASEAAKPQAPQWDEQNPPEWVRTRLSESTRAKQEAQQQYQQASQQYQQLQAAYEHQRRQLQGLVGLSPPSDEESQLGEIRTLIGRAIPGVGNIDAALSRLENLERRQWRTHANNAVETVFTNAKKTLGTDSLPRESQRVLELAFQAFVQSTPENTQRYLTNAPALYEDFGKLVEAGLIRPKTPRRSPLPRGGESGKIPTTPPEKDTRTLDQRINDSWKVIEEGRDTE
jgi:hypothetical protein